MRKGQTKSITVARALPSQEFLCECFDYDPLTGNLIWKNRPLAHFGSARICNSWNAKYASTCCAMLSDQGYIKISLSGGHYYAHRIIWKIVTGNDPVGEIDHKNNVRRDNSWDNIRGATRPQNLANALCHVNNKSGLKGVRDRPGRKYQSRITLNGIRTYLGSFETAQEAYAVYCQAAKEGFQEFWNDGKIKTPTPP